MGALAQLPPLPRAHRATCRAQPVPPPASPPPYASGSQLAAAAVSGGRGAKHICAGPPALVRVSPSDALLPVKSPPMRPPLLRLPLATPSPLHRQLARPQVCCGVSFCHSLGVAHRDLKPENILLKRHEDGSITIKVRRSMYGSHSRRRRRRHRESGGVDTNALVHAPVHAPIRAPICAI